MERNAIKIFQAVVDDHEMPVPLREVSEAMVASLTRAGITDPAAALTVFIKTLAGLQELRGRLH